MLGNGEVCGWDPPAGDDVSTCDARLQPSGAEWQRTCAVHDCFDAQHRVRMSRRELAEAVVGGLPEAQGACVCVCVHVCVHAHVCASA
jgi:hypothetical protein